MQFKMKHILISTEDFEERREIITCSCKNFTKYINTVDLSNDPKRAEEIKNNLLKSHNEHVKESKNGEA